MDRQEVKGDDSLVGELAKEVSEFIKMFAQLMAALQAQKPTPQQETLTSKAEEMKLQPSQAVKTDNLQQVTVQHYSTMLAPIFDGDCSNAIIWLIDFKEISAINKWSEDNSLNYVRQALTGTERAWFRSI